MSSATKPTRRVFKTAWLANAAAKAHLTDELLCHAVDQLALGQGDDLGGGVWKKRLNKNLHRGVIIVFRGESWVYEYLFAKKDRANISTQEMAAFRSLAKSYAALSSTQLDALVATKSFLEICHEK